MKIIEEKSQTVKEKVDKGIQYILEQVSVQRKLAEKFGHIYLCCLICRTL